VGDRARFTATATASFGGTRDATAQVEWSSSNPAVVAVAADGTVRALAAGSATITATLGTLSSTSDFMVTDPQQPTAALGSAPTVTTYGGTTYDFTVVYSDNTSISTGSIDNSDVRVVGPNGFSRFATRVGVDPAGNGSPLTATYRITPPDGSWDRRDTGTYRIELTDWQVADDAQNYAPAAVLGSFTVAAPPKTASIIINDGSAQRSMVRSLTVTFDSAVSFAGGDVNAAAAFTLTRLTGGGGNVGLNAAVSANGFGQTVVTLTFVGPIATDPLSVLNGGQSSLADGRYQLSILDGAVTGPTGLALDGDGDGAAGGAYLSPPDTSGSGAGRYFGLFRLFADATGDGVVDLSDLAALRTTFNAGHGNPAYLDYLDANNDSVVDLVDLSEFRSRFNGGVF
jgi:hypothetical protein